MKSKKKVKKKTPQKDNLKVNTSFEELVKVSVKGNPKPKKKTGK